MKRSRMIILFAAVLALAMALMTACGGEEGGSAAEAGVNPEMKAFLDEYEAFVDEYVEFIQKYENADDSQMMAMMADYMSLLERLDEFDEKLDAWDEDDMSDADLAYYTEVTLRIEKKLLDAA